jgi:hypothetical protein
LIAENLTEIGYMIAEEEKIERKKEKKRRKKEAKRLRREIQPKKKINTLTFT